MNEESNKCTQSNISKESNKNIKAIMLVSKVICFISSNHGSKQTSPQTKHKVCRFLSTKVTQVSNKSNASTQSNKRKANKENISSNVSNVSNKSATSNSNM